MTFRNTTNAAAIGCLAASGLLAGCSTYRETEGDPWTYDDRAYNDRYRSDRYADERARADDRARDYDRAYSYDRDRTYDRRTYSSQAEPDMPARLVDQADGAIDRFQRKDPTLRRFFDTSYAFAIYPVVAKGAAGIGAAHGNGVVYQGGRPIAYTEVSQGTIGLQLGGQTYSEIVFFQNQPVFDNFRNGKMKFQAQASAVAAESGAGASNDFADGVAVFTMPRAGLMFEAAIGGQQFSYIPMTDTASDRYNSRPMSPDDERRSTDPSLR